MTCHHDLEGNCVFPRFSQASGRLSGCQDKGNSFCNIYSNFFQLLSVLYGSLTTFCVSPWKNICWRHRLQSISRELLLCSTCGGQGLCIKYCHTCTCAVVCKSRTEYRTFLVSYPWMWLDRYVYWRSTYKWIFMCLMFIDVLFVCVALNLKHLLLFYDYDEDVWCVSVQKENVVPAKERKQRRNSRSPQPLIQNSWSQMCCGIQNFSSVRQIILCIYQILYVTILYYVTPPAGSGAAPCNQTL